ncbi:MAG: hypothetical protein NTY74_10110 [Ignavibacteriae bacterium]|nr:hypothetical protein [Ignavibacteriota bacterium]
MPKLINTILGKIKGTLGDITFYYKDNEQRIKSRKLPHVKSQDNSIKAKNNRSKFAQSHFFSHELKLQPEIAELWKSIDIKGSSPYFKIHGFNRMKCTVNSLTEENGITPDSITLSVENLVFQRNSLSFDYKLYRKSEPYLQPPYKLYVAAYLTIGALSRKVRENSLHFRLTDINQEGTDFTSVSIDFLEALAEDDIPKLKNLYFFIAAVKKIPGEEKYEWSSSFGKIFDVAKFEKGWYNSIELN